MRAIAWLRSLWLNIARRQRVEQSLDDELHTYVALLTAEYQRGGMTYADARRAALLATGGIDQVKEATRDAWAGNAIANARRELAYAVRTLRRSPSFLAIAVGTLAIGIGGATAVFTVINGSLFRPLPGVSEPDRLVTVQRIQNGREIDEFSYPDYLDLRARSRTLSGLTAYNGTSMGLGAATSRERVWVSSVSDDFFTVLGVRPSAGRLFAPGAASVDGDEVVVLGHALWQRRFGGATRIIGSTLQLNGQRFTIIGVAPPGFIGGMAVHPMEVWVPTATASGRVSAVLRGMDLGSRRDAWARLVGRLAPGMTVEEAQRDLAGVAAILEATHPANQGRTLRILPGAGMTPEERAEASRVPRLLAMAVAILLLIACGNVASLSLVRAAARRRELATRLALGASRAGLVRQVALEGTLIAVGAGILGIVIARLLVRSAVIVGSFAAVSNPDLSMDRRVLIVALAAAALTAIIVSLVPALQVLRVPAAAVLKDGGRSLRRRMGQRALVSAQVGASLVLLYGAAIVFTAFQRLLAAHDGVEPRRLTDIAIRSGTSGIDTASVSRFYREVLARAAAEPVVAGAALTTNIPPFEWASHATVFRRGEEPPREALVGRELELGWRVDMIPVSPGFFDVVRLPLVRGRDFDAGDTPASARVAIVSRAMADAMWPRMDAIGRFIAWPSVEGPVRVPLLVVGVAEDGRTVTGGGAPPAMYVPFTQQPATNLVLVVRSRGDAPVAPTTLRRIVASVNARVPVQGGRTLEDRLSGAVRPQRTASAWIGVFGAIALVLAGVGLYGVVAQAVLQRTRELALRCALGATPVGILRLVLDDGMRVAAAGAAVGIAGVAVSFRVLRSMLSGLGGVDGGSAVFAMAILGLAMLIATYLPARRAARLDPAAALRAD